MALLDISLSSWELLYFLNLLYAEAVELALSCPSGGIALNIGILSMCSWEGVSSASSYATILVLPLDI